jgi:excisionase family DNA binding protein
MNGDGPGERFDAHTPAELNALMHADPEWGKDRRAWVEHIWRVPNRAATEQWIRLLVDCARYLSDVIGGDVPVLAPRDVVEASVGVRRSGDDGALLIGNVVQRSIAAQVNRQAEFTNEALLEEIRRLFGSRTAPELPPTSRWLTTRDIAARLGISKATAERKCRNGEIDADKTAGNEWRTTERRLRGSPYLKSKKRRGGGNGELE